MKKIVIFLFLFFTLIINVSAKNTKFDVEKIIDGIYYEKYDGNKTYYRYVSKIIDVESKQLAYCVQPFVDLTGSDNYVGYPEYDRIFNFTEKEWERIRLYSYYGYGYKNHLEDKWISITQISLWRDIYPQYRFDWLDNLTNKRVINPYNNEIKELNNLVNSHYLKPTFNNNYVMGIKDELILTDDNKVLENFEVINSNFDYKIDNNKLTIKSLEEKEGSIEFVKAKNIYPNTSIFYYDKNSQAVIKRGNIEEVKFSIDISVKKGQVIINKLDEDSQDKVPQGEASLDGAVYEILDENKIKIKELEIKDNTLLFDDLGFGKYYIREVISGVGYYLDNRLYEVNIDKDNLIVELNLTNKAIKSKINLYKYYGSKEELDSGRGKKESNIIFEIYNKNEIKINSVKTDENGYVNFELPYGEYTIKQVNTTNGYDKVEDYKLIVNDENNYSQDIYLYDLKIKVPNAGI